MALLRMEMERTQEVFRILGNRKGGGGAVYAGTLGAVSEATQTSGSIHVSKDGRYTVRNTYTGKQHALDYSTFCVVYLQKVYILASHIIIIIKTLYIVIFPSPRFTLDFLVIFRVSTFSTVTAIILRRDANLVVTIYTKFYLC